MSGSTDAGADLAIEDGFLPAGGRWLEYRHWRQHRQHRPRGPTLVLLHEGLGSVAMWKAFPEQLAAHTGCNVFSYSRAGYGNSDPTELPRIPGYMHPEALQVLPAVLDFLNVREVVLLGHSDGASIALIHAGGVRDDRVKALIVMAPHVFIEPMCVKQIAHARTAFETGDLRPRLGKYHADVDHVFWGWNDIWLHPDFLTWNIESCLADIRVSVLVIQGAQDEYGTMAQVNAVRDQVPGGADTLILPDCGHSPHRDQPAAALEGIARFLRPFLNQ